MRTAAARLLVALCAIGVTACTHETPPGDGWIRGDSARRWQTVERQLRGLDVAMIEIGYRYQELWWAGADENWAYATYQADKIELSLKNALERRPKRRASAEEIFLPALAEMRRAVERRERAGFESAFGGLTAACNSCHAAEAVADFHVEIPGERLSPIRAAR